MKTNSKTNVKTEDSADNSSRPPACIGSDKFETTMYGEVTVHYLVFPNEQGIARDGIILVMSKEPHGMAMTEWQPKLHGSYPFSLPVSIH